MNIRASLAKTLATVGYPLWTVNIWGLIFIYFALLSHWSILLPRDPFCFLIKPQLLSPFDKGGFNSGSRWGRKYKSFKWGCSTCQTSVASTQVIDGLLNIFNQMIIFVFMRGQWRGCIGGGEAGSRETYEGAIQLNWRWWSLVFCTQHFLFFLSPLAWWSWSLPQPGSLSDDDM